MNQKLYKKLKNKNYDFLDFFGDESLRPIVLPTLWILACQEKKRGIDLKDEAPIGVEDRLRSLSTRFVSLTQDERMGHLNTIVKETKSIVEKEQAAQGTALQHFEGMFAQFETLYGNLQMYELFYEKSNIPFWEVDEEQLKASKRKIGTPKSPLLPDILAAIHLYKTRHIDESEEEEEDDSDNLFADAF